jgi:hypothetical protein
VSTPRAWPDHNTHDTVADEHDLLTPKEATIRLSEELTELDARLAELDRVPAGSRSEAQRQEYQSGSARRARLRDGIARHSKPVTPG